MPDRDIIDLYDRSPDMTLTQLSRISGRSLAYLRRLLMEE